MEDLISTTALDQKAPSITDKRESTHKIIDGDDEVNAFNLIFIGNTSLFASPTDSHITLC